MSSSCLIPTLLWLGLQQDGARRDAELGRGLQGFCKLPRACLVPLPRKDILGEQEKGKVTERDSDRETDTGQVK